MAEAGKLVAYAQIKAPEGPSGNLRKSIRIEDLGRFYVRVRAGGPLTTVATRRGWLGGTYDYAKAQEWGTKDMPANPYFYSTARAANRRLKPILREKVRNSLKKAYNARG